MLREDMIACARLIERALTLCEFGHAADAVPSLRDAQALLEKAPDEQRQRWRERKKRQRSPDVPVTSPDVPVTSPDVPVTGCDVTGDSVVVEAAVVEEGVEAEGARRMPIPPVEAQPPSLTPDVVAARATERMRELSSAVGLSTLPARKAVKALTEEGVALDRVEAILIRAAVDAWEDLTTQGARKKYRPALVFSLNSGFIGTASAALAAADRGESGFGPLDKWTGR